MSDTEQASSPEVEPVAGVAPGSDPVVDRVLMARIAASDRAALGLLYDRYAPVMLAVCIRGLSDRAEAEDLILEIFWELWDRRSRYQSSRGSPLAYVMGVTRSRLKDRLRSRNALKRGLKLFARGGPEQRSLVDDGAANRPPEQGGGVLQDLVLAEQRSRAVAALQSLDAQQRQVVELAFFDGLSHQEIADKLHEPLGTVKSRIRMGLSKLRDLLSASGG